MAEQSLRDRILSADDRKKEAVFVPQWGLSVFVRTLTGAERDDWEASIVQQRGKATTYDLRNVRARLVCKCIVDESGKRVFSDHEAEALGEKSAAALDLLDATHARVPSGTTKMPWPGPAHASGETHDEHRLPGRSASAPVAGEA